MDKRTIFLAAGGTGGHLFPAEALGVELIKRGHDVHLLTDHRIGDFKSALDDCPTHIVCSSTIKPGIIGKITSAFKIGLGLLQSFYFLIKYKPSTIIGFGGYPSFPPLFAAQTIGLTTILHEQNAVFGIANTKLKNKAAALALSFPETQKLDRDDLKKSVVTGNPVREMIVQSKGAPYDKPDKDGPFHLFITGGSHGARIFSDIIPQAVKRLSPSLQKRIHITQQCRKEDIKRVDEFYKKYGINAELSSFFQDMNKRLEKAHLIICRAGASTINDIVCVGRPAIFVPMSLHSDDQQKHNASWLIDNNAGLMMIEDAFLPETLSNQLETLMTLPDKLEQMASNAAQFGHSDAAAKLADLVEEKMIQREAGL